MHVHIDRVFTTVARNLGLKDFSRYTNNWIEWSYEAEKLIGSRDTFVQKEATYDASGAKATGTITFAANPTSGDSITLNGVKLYFRNSTDLGEARSHNEIEIGSDIYETLDNTNAQYGLIQSLTGFIDAKDEIGTYTGSAIFNYPEALNVADYSVPLNLVENGTFSNASAWTITDNNNATSAISSNSWITSNSGGGTSNGEAEQTEALVAGKSYTLTLDVTAITATTTIQVQNRSVVPNVTLGHISSTQTMTHTFTADATGNNLI